MKTPKRIQLRRTKGWRLPPNTVVVSRPSKWGNPYVVGKDGNKLSVLFSYHVMLRGRMANNENLVMREAARRELAGKNLACWCNILECSKCGVNATGRRFKICPLCGGKIVRGLCHADTLLEVANSPEPVLEEPPVLVCIVQPPKPDPN